MATSESPLSVLDVTLAIAKRASSGGGNPGAPDMSGLSLASEPGFTVTGTLADLGEITISGQNFGAKPTQRHFDRVDRYWKNGVEVVNPYGSPVDGDNLPTDYYNVNSPFLAGGNAAQMESWRLRAEAARRGRSLGYQLNAGPNGDMEFYGTGTTNAGFAGWPASQRDSEELYIRFWHYQQYFSSQSDASYASVDMQLAASLAAGATTATVVDGWTAMSSSSSSGLQEFYIVLDDGSLHYCQQVGPKTASGNDFSFTPAIPSAASIGNPVYMRDEFTVKMMRVRDAAETAGQEFNCYAFSGFRADISNDKYSLEPGYTQGAYIPGQWNLYEIYIRAPKAEADRDTHFTKRVRINGTLRLDITGILNTQGGLTGVNGAIKPPRTGWPSSGVAITNFGFEQDLHHAIPNASVRYSDIYADGQATGLGARRRVEIGIGNDDLYQCANREPCPIKTWSTDITVNLNTLPFTEAEMAQARLFVVDENDTPTLVARIQP